MRVAPLLLILLTTRLPDDILVSEISMCCLDSASRWRLRCTSKKLRRLMLEWAPRRPLILFIGGSFTITSPICELLLLLLQSVFRRVVVTERNSVFVLNVVNVMLERIQLDCMDALLNWVAVNNICIDTGGFYFPIRTFACTRNRYFFQTRARIGWWGKGIYARRRRGKMGYLDEARRLAVAGYEVYCCCFCYKKKKKKRNYS